MLEHAPTIEQALCSLLREHGLAEASALGVCGELIRDYPLVRRFGLEAVERKLRIAGMTREA